VTDQLQCIHCEEQFKLIKQSVYVNKLGKTLVFSTYLMWVYFCFVIISLRLVDTVDSRLSAQKANSYHW